MNIRKNYFWLSILSVGLLFLYTHIQAQTTTNKDMVRKIEVIGSAEKEVVPDEIYFTISLREYMRDKNKVTLDKLEKQLQSAVSAAGIPKEDFQIEDIYGYRWHWPEKEKKRPEEFLASKRYVLKLNDLSKIDKVLEKVDGKGIESVNISRYEYSKMEQLKKEIKTNALKAAQEKAGYLVQSLNHQLGEVIEIQEIGSDIYYPPMPYGRANMMMEQDMAVADDGAQDIGFKKIKVKYEMRTVFAIK